MQRLERIVLIPAMLMACAGCGGSGGSTASTATPAGSAPTQTPTQSDPTAAPADPTAKSSGTTRINDDDPAIIYSRGNKSAVNWHSFQPAAQDYKQDEHSSNFVRSGGAISGVGAVVNFNGTGITWIGKKGPHYGIASYSIDGGPAQKVDNYNATELDQNANLTVSGLAAESHVLSISLLDQKQAAASNYWQTIDAFDVAGAALAPSQATIAGYNSPELKFTGTWKGGLVSDQSDLSGGHYWSKEANASLSWTFVGSLIEVFGRPDYEDGFMDVYIDSDPNPVASVNGHWGSTDDDTLNASLLFAKKLPAGQHTIKLVVAGKHDSSAENNYVQIDQLVAFQ